ncbi:MAG: response regulator [Candidatus Hydrogenedentes bacterium]|nr:response regulator [Candidatus Hydrogenedentota bacterium]
MTGVRKVLVVDDDPEARRFVVATLVAEGWSAIEVDSGEEALLLASRENPDLIVLDLLMPGTDGFEVLRSLRSDPAMCHIPVIMLSGINEVELGAGYDADAIERRVGVPRPEAFLDKPVNANALISLASEVVEQCRNTN